MPDDAGIQKELERRTGWSRQNRYDHVQRLARKVGSETVALYVLAHHAGVKLFRFGVEDDKLVRVAQLAEDNPPPRNFMKNGGKNPTTKSADRRGVATVMILDTKDSTKLRSRLGARKYSSLMSSFMESADRLLRRHSGKLIKRTGDGFLATFTLPSNAVECGLHLAQDASERGIGVRTGLHLAEILFSGGEIDGLGVHIAARVEPKARVGKVLVTHTVQGALAGSDLTFESTGAHKLKGIKGAWELFTVSKPPST